jgi:hypothetical protein
MILSRVRTLAHDVLPNAARLNCTFSAGDTWSGWDINTHGIQIDFMDSQGCHRSATYVDRRTTQSAHYYFSTKSNSCRFRYLPGVVQEQRWNKQQVPSSPSRHPRVVFTSVFTRQQAIDSLIKKSGSKDSARLLLCIPIITLTFIDSVYRLGSSPALLAAMKVTRYQSAKVSCAASGLLKPRSHVLPRSNALTTNG